MALTAKSVGQILADMIRKLVAETDVTDVSEGSTAGVILEGAALQDYQNQLAVLKVLESSNLQSLIGTDLDNKAIEMSIPNGSGGVGRIPARRATGNVRISSSFTKLASAIYIGKPAPFAGSVKVYLQDATGWPSTGSFYMGRGTENEEGPIPYTSLTNNITFWTLDLNISSPLVNNHGYDEVAVLAQGGVRSISAGTVVRAPAASGNLPVEYTTDVNVQIQDGESEVEVPVTALNFGEEGNVSSNAIKSFASLPFTGANVTNPLPFSNGASSEGDEALRVRIKNYVATLARGTVTAISSALLGLQDPETGKTITSLNIVEPSVAGQQSKAYIDDGSGFEPTFAGQAFESLLEDSSGQEVLFKTSNFPITACIVTGTRPGPYILQDGMYLDIDLDGVIERYTISVSEFVNLNSVSVTELVRSFNAKPTISGTQNIAFRTAEGRQLLSIFDLSGNAERLKVLPSPLQILLGLPTDEIRPIFLYKNNELLSNKGATASVRTSLYPWSNLTVGDLSNVGVVIDGVTQYFTIDNTDFTTFGSSVSTATLEQWASVFKKKVAGLKVTVGGGRLAFSTWQELSSEGSVEILSTTQSGAPATWIGTNKMWSASEALSSIGTVSDFELNRLSGQIKLTSKPDVGDNLTVSTLNTRAEIKSTVAPTGFFGIGPTTQGNAKLVVGADGDFEIRQVPVSGTLSVTPYILSADSNLVRLESSDINLFANAKVNDYVYLTPDTSVAQPMTDRLNSFYRIRRRGLNTRAVDDTFVNCTLEFSAPSMGIVTATVTTTGNHNLVVQKEVTLSNTSLDPSTLNVTTGQIDGVQTVTAVLSPTQFQFKFADADLVPGTPNTVDVFIAKDAYVDLEVSDLQRQAFFGQFLSAPVSFQIGLSNVSVYIPRHSITGGNITVNAVSASLAAVFPGLPALPASFPVLSVTDENTIVVDFGTPAVGMAPPGPVTLDGEYSTVYSSYDIVEGMVSIFKCEEAFPQIIDLGSLPSQTADQIVESINSAVGVSAYKISPRQFGLRSNSYKSSESSVAVLATSAAASILFTPSVAGAIQAHVASKKSGYVGSGFAVVQDVIVPTNPDQYYATLGYLKTDKTETLIKDEAENPAAEMSSNITEYPVGLQEIGISGREYNHLKRVYNNSIGAPFEGFVRGESVIRPVTQSINGTNEDESSIGLRMSDLPLGFKDSLVVQMDLDEVNKTTAIPMAKRALIEEMQQFGQGPGTQVIFTLKDPDDEVSPGVPRPFFEPNSPFRSFDFTDFNVLLKPTMIHTVYPTLPYVGNPSDAFVIKSSQYGSVHELRFNFLLPTQPLANQLLFSHKSYEENTRTVQIVSCTLCSGPTIVGSEFTGVYTVTPSDYTSPTGAEIVQLELSALGINLSGVYQVGNIINISGNEPYAGSYIVVDTPDFDNVIVSAPGIRASSYAPAVYDGSVSTITSYTIAPKTMQDVKSAADAYFADNPIIEVTLTATSSPTAVINYPTYHTHGSTIENESLTTIAESLDYHAKRAYFGSTIHIHTYDAANNQIIGLVQTSEPVLPTSTDVLNTGFPPNYSEQECFVLPTNSKTLENWMNFTAVSPLNIQAGTTRVQDEQNIQINSLELGSAGAVRVTGVAANSQTTLAKAAPFKVGASLKVRTDYATAQSFPRDTLAEVTNKLPAPIYRAYRTQPGVGSGSSAITPANDANIVSWFRPSTVVSYSRPFPNTGRFEYRRSLSGVVGGDEITITKPSAFIAKLEITAGTGQFSTRVGDMLILRGDQSSSDVSYTSIFNAANQCISSNVDIVDKYIGYPVVHVESETIIYVIAPNITPEVVIARDVSSTGTFSSVYNGGSGRVRVSTIPNISSYSQGDIVEITGFVNAANNGRFRVAAVGATYIEINGRTSGIGDEVSVPSVIVTRQTTEVMFTPMLKAEKNIRTNYKSGAPKASNWLINPSESVYYRIKSLGGGFAYADFAFSTHEDMQLTDMSVSSDDWVQFGDAFAAANRGRFKLIAHNGTNALIFKNDAVQDEVIQPTEEIVDGEVGRPRWRIGPKSDANVSSIDKRFVRIWDGDSVFENDKMVLTNPASGTLTWFDGSLIGTWTITKIGLNRDYELFTEATIPNATSVSRIITLANSFNSIGFQEGQPYKGYKWVSGYATAAAQEEADIFLMPQTLDYKISPAYATFFKAMHKIGFDDETAVGIDGYKYYTGLIAEAHRVIDGSSTNTIAYPGVRAAGTQVEVNAPLIKSIVLAFEITARDGVSLNAIKNPVKSVVTTYINSLGVAKEVILSEVIKRVQNVPGVKSVVIKSTLPEADNGSIKVGSYEVPRISRPEDILI